MRKKENNKKLSPLSVVLTLLVPCAASSAWI